MIHYILLTGTFYFRSPTRDFWTEEPKVPYRNFEVTYEWQGVKGSATKLSYCLSGHCCVFQTEVIIVLKALQYFLNGELFSKNLLMYSVSQAGIKFLTNVVSTTILVLS